MPDNSTALVRVEGVNIAALLTHQQVIALAAGPQYCRGTNVEIRSVLLRAVSCLANKARHIPGISPQQLLRPLTLAGGQRKRQYRITRIRCWRGVGLSRTDIEHAALSIDSWAVPYRGTRRAFSRSTKGICLTRFHRRLINHMGAPIQLARRRIDRCDATAEGTTGVARIGCGCPL